MITADNIVLALASGAVGAVGSTLLSIWNARRLENDRQDLTREVERQRQAFEIDRTKLAVLRKIAGNRAAVTDRPVLEQQTSFFEGLNEVMVVFSGSSSVVAALNAFHDALGTVNQPDRLITLFKAMCEDVGIDLRAFNDSLFLRPFSPGTDAGSSNWNLQLLREKRARQVHIYKTLMSTRATPLSPAHVNALNSISIEFDPQTAEEKPVIDAWRDLHAHFNVPITVENEVSWNTKKLDLLIDLLHVMGQALGYKFSKLDIRRDIYLPQLFDTVDVQEQALRAGLSDIVKGVRAFPVIVTLSKDADTPPSKLKP